MGKQLCESCCTLVGSCRLLYSLKAWLIDADCIVIVFCIGDRLVEPFCIHEVSGPSDDKQ